MRSAKQLIEMVISGKDMSGPAFVSAGKNANKLEKDLEKMSKVGIASGLALAGGLAATIKQAADLEAGVTDALTLVEVQGDAYEEMSREMQSSAIALSRELGVSAEDISKSYYQVLSAGAEALSDDFHALTKTATMMSELVGMETSRSVEVLSDTLNSFNMKLDQAGKVANVFFTASKLTATTVPQLSEAFTEAGPAAAAMGQSIETTAAVLDAFAAKGTKGNKAGTALRIILSRLTAGTEETRNALDALGVAVYDADGGMRNLIDILADMQVGYSKLTEEQKANTLKVIAGDEAFSKLAAILEGNINKLRQWEGQLKSADGFQDAYNKKMESFEGQLKLLQAELKGIVFTIGQELLPDAKELVAKIRENAEETAEWVAQNKDLIGVTASLALGLAGAGGLAGAILKVIELIQKLKTVGAATLGTAGVIALGVVALGTAIRHFLNDAEALNQKLDEMKAKEFGLNVDEGHELRILESLLSRYKRMITHFGEETKVTVDFELHGKKMTETLPAAVATLEYRIGQLKGTLQEYEDTVIDVSQIPTPLGITPGQVDETTKAFAMLDSEISALADEIVPDLTSGTTEFGTKFQKQIEGLTEAQREANEEFQRMILYSESAKRRKDVREWAMTPEEDPFAEMTKDGQAAANKIESALNSAFRSIWQRGNIFEAFMKSIWRSIADEFIRQVNRMIAQWIVFEAIKAGARLFGLPLQLGGTVTDTGAVIPEVVSFGTAQTGGTILRGVRGIDSVPLIAGKDETVLSHELTDALRKNFVNRDDGEFAGNGRERVTIQFNVGIMNASEQESIRFGRNINRDTSSFLSRFVARGTR